MLFSVRGPQPVFHPEWLQNTLGTQRLFTIFLLNCILTNQQITWQDLVGSKLCPVPHLICKGNRHKQDVIISSGSWPEHRAVTPPCYSMLLLREGESVLATAVPQFRKETAVCVVHLLTSNRRAQIQRLLGRRVHMYFKWNTWLP